MDKKEIKTFVNSAATKAANTANEKAQSATGWRRWLWAIGAIIAAAVAWFTSGCTCVAPEQVHAVHVLYHALTGEPCNLPAPVVVPTVK